MVAMDSRRFTEFDPITATVTDVGSFVGKRIQNMSQF
jgi:hypothetical protein